MSIGIVPSILSADFTRLGDQVRDAQAAGAQRIQVDVMDGHFVPNITMGPMIVAAVRRCTSLPLEAHLMITNPEQYIEDFASAGADVIIIHQEVSPHLHRLIEMIKTAGKMAAVALTPSTPIFLLEDILSLLEHGADHDRQPRLRRSGIHPRDAAKNYAPAPGDYAAEPALRHRSGRRHS